MRTVRNLVFAIKWEKLNNLPFLLVCKYTQLNNMETKMLNKIASLFYITLNSEGH